MPPPVVVGLGAVVSSWYLPVFCSGVNISRASPLSIPGLYQPVHRKSAWRKRKVVRTIWP